MFLRQTESSFASALVLFRKNQNFVHHAKIFVKQDMAVKHEGAGNRGIAEIKATLDAVVGMTWSLPEGNLIGVAQLRRDGLSIHFGKQEMDLVDVEIMGLEGVVFDDPVFDGADMSGDCGLLVGFENLLFLSVNRDVELDGTVGP